MPVLSFTELELRIIRAALVHHCHLAKEEMANDWTGHYWEDVFKETETVLKRLHFPKEFDYKSQKIKAMFGGKSK